MLRKAFGFAFGVGGLAVSLAFYSSVLVSPGVFWPAQFMGFAIPWILLFNFLSAAVLIRMGRYRQAMFPGIALLPAVWFLPATLQVPRSNKIPDDRPVLKVFSYNVASLAGKRWRPHMRRENARDMMAWVLKRDADLLILQEFYQNPAVPEYKPIEKLKKNGYKSVLFSNHHRPYAKKGYGVAIASKFPLSNMEVWERQKATNNQIVTADLDWQGKRYRIINVHLQSNKLTWAEIGIKRPPDELRRNFLSIFQKIKLASKQRARQVALLCKLIDESPYPVLLAGDFNDTPYSYTYWQVRRRLNNAFEKAGRGFGFTYNGKLPGLRIDHQFFSKELTCVGQTTHREVDLSDHFPISAWYIESAQR